MHSQRVEVGRSFAANCIVGGLLELAFAVPLMLGLIMPRANFEGFMLFGGLPFVVLAMATELNVRSQLSLGRDGVRTPATFVKSECEVLSRRRWAEIPRLITTYEYFTLAGRRCTGKTMAAGAFGSGFGKSVHPEIVYDPADPPRHRMLNDMWALKWRER